MGAGRRAPGVRGGAQTMNARLSLPQRHGGRLLPLRFAARELRAGLRGFYVFIACTALGVMAIAGVSSLAAGLGEGLPPEGRGILGRHPPVPPRLPPTNPRGRAFSPPPRHRSPPPPTRAIAP